MLAVILHKCAVNHFILNYNVIVCANSQRTVDCVYFDYSIKRACNKEKKLCPFGSNGCTYVGNLHLTQLERHTQRHGFHDQRTLFVSINDLKWSGGTSDFWRKNCRKAIPFLVHFLQECVGYTFTISTSYWFLRDKLFIGESMIPCLEKRMAMH
jgi:hypothetical protein